MKLYLMQHGNAVGKDVDPARPLSEEGCSEVDWVATFLKNAHVGVGRILYSDKLRAEQTAERLVRVIAPGTNLELCAGIQPNDAVEPFAAELASWSVDTLVVGHMPFMARLVSYLLTGDAGVQIAAFHPGTVVCLTRDELGRWSLGWMIRPEILAARFS